MILARSLIVVKDLNNLSNSLRSALENAAPRVAEEKNARSIASSPAYLLILFSIIYSDIWIFSSVNLLNPFLDFLNDLSS